MITGVVLARNEEQNIVACLEALQPHVSELLLIDMESSDRTVALATPFVRKVLRHPLTRRFDAARNLAVAEAAHDWLWYVDADERVPATTGRVVNDLVRNRSDEFEALTIPFKSYFCGRWIRSCGWWPGYTMPRVLKRGHFRFPEHLHGGVEVQGRDLLLPPDPELGVDHYSYRDLSQYLEKLDRYTTTEAEFLAGSGARWSWQASCRAMMQELWRAYELKGAPIDGDHGWILAWLSAQYRWLTHAKLRMQAPANGHEPAPSVPPSLDHFLASLSEDLEVARRAQPVLPLGLVWRSPLFDPSGYADEGRCFVKALARGERPLAVEELRWSDAQAVLLDAETALLRSLLRVRRARSNVAITDCIPTLCSPDPVAGFNVLRTTFETDRIPESWLARLEAFDEIWVIAEHNRRAFCRSGVAPEKIRVVPSCLDTDLFQPQGPWLTLPEAIRGRFVFLSIFDWQWRKGWDLLIRAYCEEFRPEEPVGLLLKVSYQHGHRRAETIDAIARLIGELGQGTRPDVVLIDDSLPSAELPGLYRAADAFVLASRGEGWGRPYLEAMACGRPVIGTVGSGNSDFMRPDNSFLVETTLVPVPDHGAREIPPYAGHAWLEPDLAQLRAQLRRVSAEPETAREIAARATTEVRERYGLVSGCAAVESAVRDIELKLAPPAAPPERPEQLRIVLDGELFTGHSFATVNEHLALQLSADSRTALSLHRRFLTPGVEDRSLNIPRLRQLVDRPFSGPVDVTIRHAFPPDWSRPQGKWVHIQPWEFGHLPTDWIAPLRDDVDEIWVPSEYVRRVYEQSGIPGHKIHRIPWGIDPAIFRPDAVPRLLPTRKRFRFLYVGGTIERKGFDTLLAAYLGEFGPEDDVCLVVKDSGWQSWYRYGNLRDQVLAAAARAENAQIVYLDQEMTPGQLAGIYAACHCLVAPYRGEGFGLPVLEAMGCGLPVVVPRGGATDDFVSAENGYLLPSLEVEGEHPWSLCGPPRELHLEIADVRQALRAVYQDPAEAQRRGLVGSALVHQSWTWAQTGQAMVGRLEALTGRRSTEPAKHVQATSTAGDALAALAGFGPGIQEPWLHPWIRPHGRVFVDVGAHVGTWSRALARHYERVHAIEPNPTAHPGLHYELPKNVRVHPIAAWKCSERRPFSVYKNSMHLSTLFGEEGIGTGPRLAQVEFDCQPIDSLGIEGPVDFLKCDTEGAEVECLEGAAMLVARDRPHMLIEVHTTQTFQRLTRLLADWNYVFHVVRDPNYEPLSERWYSHCWIVGQPLPGANNGL